MKLNICIHCTCQGDGSLRVGRNIAGLDGIHTGRSDKRSPHRIASVYLNASVVYLLDEGSCGPFVSRVSFPGWQDPGFF